LSRPQKAVIGHLVDKLASRRNSQYSTKSLYSQMRYIGKLGVNTAFPHYFHTNINTGSPASSIVAESAKAARTSSRQRPSAFLHNRAAQARRKSRTAPIGRHLPSILDHPTRLRRCILYLERTLAGRVRVVGIRQIHYGDFAGIVAPKECWSFIKPLAHEGSWGWDDGHLRQAGELRLQICLVELAAVRKVGGHIRGVVIHKDDTDGARRLDEGE